MVITVFVDGLAEPRNPGTGTYGYVIYRDGKKISEGKGFSGNKVSNNYSEYCALIEALNSILKFKEEEVVVYSDSKLLVNQMSGKWKVKKGQYIDKYLKSREVVKEFKNIRFEWIPRDKNREADYLSRLAYYELSKH